MGIHAAPPLFLSEMDSSTVNYMLDGELRRNAWLFLAGAMGAVSSLAFLKPLTWKGRLLSLFVSLMSTVFLAPALVEWFLPHAPANSKLVAAIYYLVSASVMSAFPPFLTWVTMVAKDPVAYVRDTIVPFIGVFKK